MAVKKAYVKFVSRNWWKFMLLFVGLYLGMALVGCQSDEDNQAEQVVIQTLLPDGVSEEFLIDQETADAFHATLREMRSLQGGSIPNHFFEGETTPQEGDFNPNDYFMLLTHLSMEPGYVLDYNYTVTSLGGHPSLFGRTESTGDVVSYRTHVVLDDTPESYLEYMALLYMGDQFYLDWHDEYNDEILIANQAGARVGASRAASFCFSDQETADAVRAEVEKWDMTPVVVIGETEVNVRLVIFSKWGGYKLHSFTFSREFPHNMIDHQDEILVEVKCEVQI